MQKWIVYISIVICFLLILFIGGGQYWLKRHENKESGTEVNNIVCEYGGKIYQLGERFWMKFPDGCSFCECGEAGVSTCKQKLNCLEAGFR